MKWVLEPMHLQSALEAESTPREEPSLKREQSALRELSASPGLAGSPERRSHPRPQPDTAKLEVQGPVGPVNRVFDRAMVRTFSERMDRAPLWGLYGQDALRRQHPAQSLDDVSVVYEMLEDVTHGDRIEWTHFEWNVLNKGAEYTVLTNSVDGDGGGREIGFDTIGVPTLIESDFQEQAVAAPHIKQSAEPAPARVGDSGEIERMLSPLPGRVPLAVVRLVKAGAFIELGYLLGAGSRMTETHSAVGAIDDLVPIEPRATRGSDHPEPPKPAAFADRAGERLAVRAGVGAQ